MKPVHIDYMLDKLNMDLLKKIAQLWGATGKQNKQQAIDHVRIGLGIPSKVRETLHKLKPHEYNALALAKILGNRLNTSMLVVASHSTGYPLPRTPSATNSYGQNMAQPLVDMGLFLFDREQGHSYWDNSYYEQGNIVTDPRLLAQVGSPIYQPLPLKPHALNAPASYRRPTNITLDIINLLQAIEAIGTFELTKAGTVRATQLRVLKNSLGWKKDTLDLDGWVFDDVLVALFGALQHTPMFKTELDYLIMQETTEQFAERPVLDQVSYFLSGFMQQPNWFETGKQGYTIKENYRAARLALLMALGTLPTEPDNFFSFAEFELAWFKRMGEHFSLNSTILTRNFQIRQTPDEVRLLNPKWGVEMRNDWLQMEYPWLEKALTTWVYYFGLVELQVLDKKVVGLRLTPLGRALLHDQGQVEDSTGLTGTSEPVWVVQPNFDVVVYLEKTTSAQLIFLERYAQRTQVQQHMAQYHLTRDSVYAGLERGGEIESFIEQLQAHATMPLPQNIVMDLQEWGQLRNQMTLYAKASLIEYSNVKERDLLTVHLKGKPIGERFFLLDQPISHWVETRIDYEQSLPRCLSINEEGLIKVKRSHQDLLLAQQLNKWAETRTDHMWQLTQASVSQAIAAKGRIGELFSLLDERLLVSRLPSFLEQTLQSWSGKKLEVTVADITVIRCLNPELFKAIAKSRALRPYLHGVLAADLLLVKRSQLSELKEKLTWANLNISEELTLGEAIPDKE